MNPERCCGASSPVIEYLLQLSSFRLQTASLIGPYPPPPGVHMIIRSPGFMVAVFFPPRFYKMNYLQEELKHLV